VSRPITATIAVCTRNRADVLVRCLASLDTQLVAPGRIETLVVDNGSTDSTPEVLRRWADAAPNRNVVTEPRVGVARARNAALTASARDVIVFIDDDALAPSTWVQAHLDVYDSDADVGIVGGPIGLVWPTGRPAFLTDELTGWFSALDLGDETIPFPITHGPYGANMSVRRRAAIDAGGFEPSLGRVGKSLVSCEEPDLTRRVVAAGWSMIYAASAAVVQQVPAERSDLDWLVRRVRAQGVSIARMEVLDERLSRGQCFLRSIEALGKAGAVRRQMKSDDDVVARRLGHLVELGRGLELLRLTARRLERTPDRLTADG
jgi:glycosyltransferase involved in cell wall biosynthesis